MAALLSDGSEALALEHRENEQLRNLLEDTLASNEMLEKEKHMFERFLKRLDPKDFQLKDMQKRKVRIKEGTSSEILLQLSMDQKCNIATRELDELRERMQRDQEDAQVNYDNLRAVVQEAELRLAEIKKATYEFDRDVLRGSVNPRTQRIMAEKVVKYFDDRLKSRDSLAEKLRSKNASLKVKRRKLQSQLKQKEEAGEVRNEVDFKQLKIENQQLSERCDEKNHELLQLKLRAANTLQILNTYKKKLHSLSVESEAVDHEIDQRRELQGRVELETTTVTREKAKAEAVNAESRRKLEDYKVPDVMEYVQERASLCELTKAVKEWERKVEISKMALRTYQQTWKKLVSQHQQRQKSLLRATHTTTPTYNTALY